LTQIRAFSGYGFPMSHALAFAHLVFSSAWLKCYYPAALCAGLLRAQPMGFYSPQSLVTDARRHGVVVRGADLHASNVHPELEPDTDSIGGQAVRIGLADVRLIDEDLAERIVAARTAGGPFVDQVELVARCGLREDQLAALATAGALAAWSALPRDHGHADRRRDASRGLEGIAGCIDWNRRTRRDGVKLLLTSSGIANTTIHEALVDLLGKPIEESERRTTVPLTSEQRDALWEKDGSPTCGHIIVSARPGTGKTLTVTEYCIGLLNTWPSLHSPWQGIAMLSYTNVAKDELEDKVRKVGHGHRLLSEP
jgi:hypothetical protein